MGDLVKSLSVRFYLALVCAIVVIGIGFSFTGLLGLLGTALGSTVIILLGLVPLLSLLLGLFYRIFGLVRPTPPWRERIPAERFAPAVSITYPDRGDQPYWARQRKEQAGTLRDFLRQHQLPKDVDDTDLSIGIVLSGGGAKGVYQAGALHALWEFLEREQALPYVRVVTGTSIGAWNAMFWLTRQVADHGLRDWWASASPPKIIGPTFYLPFVRNYILHNRPWQAQFSAIFGSGGPALLAGGPPFFYFTRTNVQQARLEFTTNHLPTDQYWGVTTQGYAPLGRIVDDAKGYHQVKNFGDLQRAVFTSMDIPPAFPRLPGPSGEACEDGGVIENLPIRFTTWFEGCNLLFVFPLNATFEAAARERSMLLRMFRVMDIRQGALERNALRDIALYNTLIGGKQNVNRQMHIKPVTTFCICPEPPLEVGTFAFWKTQALGPAAYALMYEATRAELARFDFSVGNHEVWMATVGSQGEIGYKDFTLR